MSNRMTDRDLTSLGGTEQTKKTKRLGHNNSMHCEVERIEKFRLLIITMAKEHQFLATVKAILQTIPEIVNCKEATLFGLTNMEMNLNCKELMVQRTLLENKYIDLVCLETDSPVNPLFSKLSQTQQLIRTKAFMSVPIYGRDGQVSHCLQVTSRLKKGTQID
jgi:hypothetical protein